MVAEQLAGSSRGYCGAPGAQLHWRLWEADSPSSQPDLYCFHPAPLSGLAFQNIAPLLAKGRRVIAPDYPGYGGSDALGRMPAIDDYAASMAGLIAELSGAAPADMLGFHTGCLVAAQLALLRPAMVRKACLIDVPAMDAETSAKMVANFATGFAPEASLETLAKPWEGTFVKRIATQGTAQALGLFAEQLRAGEGMNEAFHAAFSWAWQDKFPQLETDVMVLASQSGLLEGSRRAGAAIPGAQLVEMLEVTRSVLDEAAPITAKYVEEFLSGCVA